MRPRADDAHAPLQHVDELRQLVERRAAQEGTERRDARIAPGGLPDHVAVVHRPHRAELVDDDLLAVQPVAALPEDHGPGRRQLDADRDQQEQRRDQHEDDRRQHDVADPLDQLVRAGERRLADADDRYAVDVLQAALDDADAEHVGHEVDRRRRALHRLEQLDDARLRTERQRDVDIVDRMLADVRRRLLQRAQALRHRIGMQPFVGAVVEVADEVDPVVAAREQRVRRLHAERPGPHDHGRAPVLRQGGPPARAAPADRDREQLHRRRDDPPPDEHVPVEEAETGRRVPAQQQDQQEADPGRRNAHRRSQHRVLEAVAARERQSDHEQAEGQVRALDRVIEPPGHADVHGDRDRRLQQRRHQRADRLRRAEERTFVVEVFEHRWFRPARIRRGTRRGTNRPRPPDGVAPARAAAAAPPQCGLF